MLVSRLVVQEGDQFLGIDNGAPSNSGLLYEADCTQWSRDYEEDPGFKEDPVMV